MSISRRTILKYGLGGALVLGAAGTGIALQRTRMRQPARPLRALDLRTFSILAAVADRITPATNGFPSAEALEVPEKIDDLLSRAEPGLLDEMKQALLFVENGLAGLLFDGRPKPFSALSAEGQDAALRSMKESALPLRRTVYKALQGLCAAVYYASPETYPLVGYPGPPDFGNLAAVGDRP